MSSGEELLRRYLPILRFHSEELYSVVGVEAMSDFYFTDGPGAPRWTRLKRIGEESAIAEARADAGVLLNSSFLATNYGPDWPASENDFLDTANLSYAVDAAIAQENPAHTNVIYGTVAERADGEPGRWLQYWFFFTYNSKAALRSRVGVHEGDWEMIQVRLDGRDRPEAVTYAQHRSGQSAPWRIPKTTPTPLKSSMTDPSFTSLSARTLPTCAPATTGFTISSFWPGSSMTSATRGAASSMTRRFVCLTIKTRPHGLTGLVAGARASRGSFRVRADRVAAGRLRAIVASGPIPMGSTPAWRLSRISPCSLSWSRAET